MPPAPRAPTTKRSGRCSFTASKRAGPRIAAAKLGLDRFEGCAEAGAGLAEHLLSLLPHQVSCALGRSARKRHPVIDDVGHKQPR